MGVGDWLVHDTNVREVEAEEYADGEREGRRRNVWREDATSVDVWSMSSETLKNVRIRYRDRFADVSRTRNIPPLLAALRLSPRTTCSS